MNSIDVQLRNLSDEVRHLERTLDDALKGDTTLAKWMWPEGANTVVEQLRSLDHKMGELVRAPLDALLDWPNKGLADRKLFYGSKPGFETFDRGENWFDFMGFDKYETPYTFSNAWDKRLIKATFLVPKRLKAGMKVPIMWFFHGGGFCTGAGDFAPWYAKSSIEHARRKNAVIIAPNYPLGPEGNYKDIVDSIRDFLRWYKDDGCFEPGFTNWTKWLTSQAKLEGVKLELDRVLVEGESAGGHAAVMAMFLNADRKSGTMLNIEVMLLRYPMIKHYQRTFPTHGSATYMNLEFSVEEIQEHAEYILAAVAELEYYDLVPTRESDQPPHGMAFAFLLSMSGDWPGMFQRRHPRDKAGSDAKEEEEDYMDCLQRAQYYDGKVNPDYLPPIVIYHGHDDVNCLYRDTEEFQLLMMKHYGNRYVENKTIFLEKVDELHTKKVYDGRHKSLEMTRTSNVGHGFDYDLIHDSEGFLVRAHETIDRFWCNGLW